MKKVKLFLLISSIALIFSLSSCDLSSIFGDSTKERDKKEDKNEDNKQYDNNDNDKKDDDNPLDSYDLSIYLSDYNNKYGYQMLGTDLEHGDVMQKAYKEFYDSSKNFLLSEDNYELSTSKIDNETTNFVTVFESEFVEDLNYLDYYKSAWSVFISENPIFYFLSNGYLIRTKTTTTQRTSNGEVIESHDVTTYSFLLLSYDNYNTFEERDKINKKIDELYKATSNFNELENQYDKALAINNYLKDNLEYAYKSDGITPEDGYWAHNILGLIEFKKGVCEAYSKGFKLLSDQYGLDVISVYGNTKKTNEAHAWNYIKMNDNWYGMDVTWNDSTNNDKYFLCNKSIMDDDHVPYTNSSYDITYQVELPTLSEEVFVNE